MHKNTDPYGRDATQPLSIPPRGWWQVVERVYSESVRDNLSVVAAGSVWLLASAGFSIYVSYYAKDLWLARSCNHLTIVVLYLLQHHPPGCGNKRRARAANRGGHDNRPSEAYWKARCFRRRPCCRRASRRPPTIEPVTRDPTLAKLGAT